MEFKFLNNFMKYLAIALALTLSSCKVFYHSYELPNGEKYTKTSFELFSFFDSETAKVIMEKVK